MYARVNGIDLYYEEHGPADALPLVLMHGGSGSLDDAEAGWSSLIPLLSAGYRVLALEHRGHGRTGNTEDHLNYELIAADVSAFAQSLNLPPAHFGGVSDGGIVGLYLALTDPSMLRSMVCVGVNYRVDHHIMEFLEANVAPEAIEERHPAWAADLARRHDPHHGEGY